MPTVAAPLAGGQHFLVGAYNNESGGLPLNYTTADMYLDGDLCELLFYKTTLSSSDRHAIEEYLRAKWSIFTANQTLTSVSYSGTGQTFTVGTPITPMVATVVPSNPGGLTFAATGLPGGLTLNTLTGTISGTPLFGATWNLAVTVANLNGSVSASYALNVGPVTFDPSMVTGLCVRFDAASANTTSSGGLLTGWKNEATGATGIIVGSPAYNATIFNGKPAVVFGTAQCIHVTATNIMGAGGWGPSAGGNNKYSCFIVSKLPSGGVNASWGRWAFLGVAGLQDNSNPQAGVILTANNISNYTAVMPYGNNGGNDYQLATVLHSNTNSLLQMDGIGNTQRSRNAGSGGSASTPWASTTTGATNITTAPNLLMLGAGTKAGAISSANLETPVANNWQLAEFLIYNNNPSTTDTNNIIRYLQSKRGV